MEKTFKIKGMGCEHCARTVSAEIEKIDGVDSVICTYDDGQAIIKMSKDVPDKLIKEAVEKAGYEM